MANGESVKCPKCGLYSPKSAIRCDCGYDFASGQVKTSYLGQEQVQPPQDLPFCWGVTGLTPLWLLSHGRRGIGLLTILLSYILSKIGLAGGALGLGLALLVAIALGLHGSKIAWTHGNYRTVDELRRGERGWTIFGIIVFGLQVAGLLAIIIRL